jgi:hypothetical protein
VLQSAPFQIFVFSSAPSRAVGVSARPITAIELTLYAQESGARVCDSLVYSSAGANLCFFQGRRIRCPSGIGPENQELVLKILCAQLGRGVDLGPRLLCRSSSCLEDGLGQELSRPMVLM